MVNSVNGDGRLFSLVYWFLIISQNLDITLLCGRMRHKSSIDALPSDSQLQPIF